VTDGLSKTFAVGERHIPPEESDWDVNLLHFLQGDNCFLAADSIMTILRGTEDGLADGPHDDSEDVFGSNHPGITQFVFLDGHAESIANNRAATGVGVNPMQVEDIDVDDEWLWLAALSTVAGEEMVND
jgi:hypothetical protein